MENCRREIFTVPNVPRTPHSVTSDVDNNHKIVSRNNITGAAADCDHVIPSVDIQFEPTQSDLICS
ncbi:hypothetical protein J6590_097188, partial [Homalodisca vitripennis]